MDLPCICIGIWRSGVGDLPYALSGDFEGLNGAYDGGAILGTPPKFEVDPNGSVFGNESESVGDILEDGLAVKDGKVSGVMIGLAEGVKEDPAGSEGPVGDIQVLETLLGGDLPLDTFLGRVLEELSLSLVGLYPPYPFDFLLSLPEFLGRVCDPEYFSSR